MNLSYAGCSEAGLVRKRNEDAYLMRVSDAAGLFLVADGVGSREYGETASHLLRDGYARWWDSWLSADNREYGFPKMTEELRKVLFDINLKIIQQFGITTAGSTLALLFLYQGQCLYLSSGDSRIYHSRGVFSFRQVTVDDVYENYLDKTETFEKSSVGKLVGAVGISEQPMYSVRTDRIRRGDCFFLCSDGVYRLVPASALRSRVVLGAQNPPRLVASLSRVVEQKGALDNYSMICVRVQTI